MNVIRKEQKLFCEIYSYGSNLAAISKERTISYNELAEICNCFEAIFDKKNLVFLFCSNTIGAFVGYVALMNNNQVPLMLEYDSSNEVVVDLLKRYKPKYLFLPKNMSVKYNEFLKIYDIYDYVLLQTADGIEYPINSKLALLLSTSGSTGSAKFVRQSYKNIRKNAESILEYLNIDSCERPITVLPMSYTYGLSIINSHLIVGATLLITEKKVVQKEFWDFFICKKATSISGVPYTYQLLKKIGFMKMDLPSLRTMTQAGGMLMPELHYLFAEYAINNKRNFYIMYGQTEATARMTYLPCERVQDKCGSIGIAIPRGKIILVDEKGNEIKTENCQGEIVYYGDNVTMGYANSMEDLSKGDERGGILYTGDIAQKDKEGFLYITGRKNRFAKIYGKRINLDEVEKMILNHFRQIEICCSERGEQLIIYINTKNVSTHIDIMNYVSMQLRLSRNVIKVKYLSCIPRSNSGKVLFSAINDNNF